MRRVMYSFVALAVTFVLQPALARADGSAPICYRHGGVGSAAYAKAPVYRIRLDARRGGTVVASWELSFQAATKAQYDQAIYEASMLFGQDLQKRGIRFDSIAYVVLAKE